MLVLIVDDLGTEVAALAERGLRPDAAETLPDAGRATTFLDPEGHYVTFAQPGSAAAGSPSLARCVA